jgi:hypothetical protein
VGSGYRPTSNRVYVRLVAISICVAAAGLSCPSEAVKTPADPAVQSRGDVVLFFTGSELGILKPCGCSGGQLGGLEKRTGIFAEIPRADRLVIDTGDLVQGTQEQDLIKFRIQFEAFSLLDYDLVHLTPQDLEIAGQLHILGDGDRAFDIIGAQGQDAGVPKAFSRQFSAGGRPLAVNVVAYDAQNGDIGATGVLFPDVLAEEAVNVLILRGCRRGATQNVLPTAPPNIDCVICPSDSDEPQILSVPGARPLAFTVGRFGRYVCRLDVTVPQQQGPAVLRFTEIRVEEQLPADEALVQLYRSYQQLVRESNLLEKYPRIPLPDDLVYTGSKSCASCHEYEFEKWSAQPHASALATLQKVGSDRDPECVICHVVGMEYTEGFITEEQTPHLKDVGCEVCHGPGSEHILTEGKAKTTQPQTHCTGCHTPEHSGDYEGHEEEFMKKIMHWREP